MVSLGVCSSGMRSTKSSALNPASRNPAQIKCAISIIKRFDFEVTKRWIVRIGPGVAAVVAFAIRARISASSPLSIAKIGPATSESRLQPADQLLLKVGQSCARQPVKGISR